MVMGERGRAVEEIILERLKNEKVPDQVADLVIKAMRGDEAAEQESGPPPQRDHGLTYLQAITVHGFGGIGPKVTVKLRQVRV